VIWMFITSGVWSEGCQNSEKMVWLSNSKKLDLRNMRSMMKFELLSLFKYLVGTELVEYEKDRLKTSAMSISKSL